MKKIRGVLIIVVLLVSVCFYFFTHQPKNIFDEISDDYPSLNNTQIRNTLAAFLFTGDDVYKLIGDLSGGERGRVSLAKLMLSEANFLILDEPFGYCFQRNFGKSAE